MAPEHCMENQYATACDFYASVKVKSPGTNSHRLEASRVLHTSGDHPPARAAVSEELGMCYSAQVVAEYKAYLRLFGAGMGLKEFYELFWRRSKEPDLINIPKAMEDAFSDPQNAQEREIKDLVDAYRARQSQEWTELLFAQKTRLAAATRKLAEKPTKTAEKDQGIASRKIAQIEGWLADLRRVEPKDRDARIYPDHYAPVMVVRDGQRVVLPMRYHCLPAGKPAFYDAKFPGTFNARRDSLEGFWSGQFGVTHGVTLWSAFYENVPRHKAEGRELADDEKAQNVILQFKPETQGDMLVACLWSHWTGKNGEPELLSFAAITDEPPPEVAAAGHDRCIIPIKHENIEAWLHPDPKNLAAQYAILDDRQRPNYEHRKAA